MLCSFYSIDRSMLWPRSIIFKERTVPVICTRADREEEDI